MLVLNGLVVDVTPCHKASKEETLRQRQHGYFTSVRLVVWKQQFKK